MAWVKHTFALPYLEPSSVPASARLREAPTGPSTVLPRSQHIMAPTCSMRIPSHDPIHDPTLPGRIAERIRRILHPVVRSYAAPALYIPPAATTNVSRRVRPSYLAPLAGAAAAAAAAAAASCCCSRSVRSWVSFEGSSKPEHTYVSLSKQ